jgi:EpsD family peptidyl-prolyl cis-trans isomerase
MARLEGILTRRRMPLLAQVSAAACIAALLTSCNQHAGPEQSTQVVAKVNDNEITLGELQAAVDASGADTNTLVDSLIDEELLVQSALANHLDRDPTVAQQIERARRQILARAFEERSVLPHTEISADAYREYYRTNPALFAHRQIYRTLTFSIARTELTDALRNALDHARSAIDVRQLLDRHRVAFEAVETTRPAEDIPIDILAQLAQAAIGDVLIAAPAREPHALLICVVDMQDSPIDLEQARPQITQHMTDARNREIVARYMQRARSQARISYTDAGAVAASAGNADKREASALE